MLRLKIDPSIEIDEDILKARLAAAGGGISVRDLSEDLMSAQQEPDGDHIFSFKPENMWFRAVSWAHWTVAWCESRVLGRFADVDVVFEIVFSVKL